MNTMNTLLKRTILVSTMMLTLGLSYSFAAPTTPAVPARSSAPTDEIAVEVKASFRREFKNAEVLSWDVTRKFTKVTFRMNEIVMFAFFSDNGQLLAVTRNIRSNQLPIPLQMNLKKDYSEYWITDLFEINGDEQNCYYITLETGDSKLVMRSIDNEKWEVYETIAKK